MTDRRPDRHGAHPRVGTGFDATSAVMLRLGYRPAGLVGSRTRRGTLRNAVGALAALVAVAACIAWWGARSGSARTEPAVGDAIRGSVANGAGRLEAILLGMPRPVDSSPTLSAEADGSPGRAAAPANGRTRTY